MKCSSSRVVRAALAIGLLAGMTTAYAADPVSTDIKPPSGSLMYRLTATGVQIYTCQSDASHHLAWVFKQPKAALYDEHGRLQVQHDAGPSWQADDGSRITGHVVGQKPSDTAGSVPQLLLEAKNAGGPGQLAGIRSVQRLDTVGGVAPTTACETEGQQAQVPYYAHYLFWK